MAFYDGYPIVTNDTGTYISRGFTLIPPIDRPIFYGFFIHLSSLGLSLWLTVFTQCMLLSSLIIKLLKDRIPNIADAQLLGMVIIVSLFTICGWYASQIMPDIFVAILILAIVNYFLTENSRIGRSVLMGIILLSTIVHNSNIIILTLFSIIVFAISFFKPAIKIFRSKSVSLIVITALSWLILCFSNFWGGKGFTTSNSTHVFVMGKLVESGVLKTYLDNACPVKNYNICAYKDSLPSVAWEFHYDATSPLQKTGGWEANRQEYNTIIKDIFSRPKYYPFIIYKSLEATLRQLTLLNIDGTYTLPWMVFDKDTPPYKSIDQYYPHEIGEFKNSRQNTKAYNISVLNAVFSIYFVLSSLLCLFFLPKTLSKEAQEIYLLVLFPTATLSSVNDRLNSRVIWLIPFVNTIFLYKTFQRMIVTRKPDTL